MSFCKLQGRQIYKGCCELDLYFASEVICCCKPYIPRHMLDDKAPRSPLIPWKIPINVYGVPSSRFSRGLLICYSNERYPTYFNGNYRRVTIEDNKEETLRSLTMKKSKSQNPKS